LDNHHPPCTDDNHLSRGDGWIYLGHAVNREAAQLALDAIHLWHWAGETHLLMAAHDALRKALAQPEQDPSKQTVADVCMIARNAIDRIIELESSKPAQRTWVGLTDEEIWSVVSRIGTSDSNVNPLIVLSDARAIEAKLKEKNT